MTDQSRGFAPFPDARPPDPAAFGDYPLIEAGDDNTEGNSTMDKVLWLLSGGFAKGYRTQVLGTTAFLAVVAGWAVGDMTLASLLHAVPAMLGSLGIATLGAKVNKVEDKVEDVKVEQKAVAADLAK